MAARIFQVPHFRSLVGERQRLQGFAVADPFAIACAQVGEDCVITEEAQAVNKIVSKGADIAAPAYGLINTVLRVLGLS